jgi:hypothetical protein
MTTAHPVKYAVGSGLVVGVLWSVVVSSVVGMLLGVAWGLLSYAIERSR